MQLMFPTTDTLKMYLNEAMQYNILEIEFTKADGSTRIMKATKDTRLMPAVEPVNTIADGTFEAVKAKPIRAVNPGVLNVWDIENNGWRSITLSSIKRLYPSKPTPLEIAIGEIN
jgi:hypothetical protein